jgi:hypothetical protein
MPENAVYVGRPTRWGNPFCVDGFFMCGRFDGEGYTNWCIPYLTHEGAVKASVDLFSDLVHGFWNPTKVSSLSHTEYAALASETQAWRQRIGTHPMEAVRSELSGRDLCCWCPLDSPCHADVLLNIAAGGGGVSGGA